MPNTCTNFGLLEPYGPSQQRVFPQSQRSWHRFASSTMRGWCGISELLGCSVSLRTHTHEREGEREHTHKSPYAATAHMYPTRPTHVGPPMQLQRCAEHPEENCPRDEDVAYSWPHLNQPQVHCNQHAEGSMLPMQHNSKSMQVRALQLGTVSSPRTLAKLRFTVPLFMKPSTHTHTHADNVHAHSSQTDRHATHSCIHNALGSSPRRSRAYRTTRLHLEQPCRCS